MVRFTFEDQEEDSNAMNDDSLVDAFGDVDMNLVISHPKIPTVAAGDLLVMSTIDPLCGNFTHWKSSMWRLWWLFLPSRPLPGPDIT